MSELVPVLIIIVAAILAAYLIHVSSHATPDDETDEASPMNKNARRTLVAYLLLVGFGFVYMLASLVSLEFPETPLLPEASNVGAPPSAAENRNQTTSDQGQGAGQTGGTSNAAVSQAQPPSPAPTPSTSESGAPVLLHAFPQSTPSDVPNLQLALYGRNFSRESTVRINMRDHAKEYLAPDLLRVPLVPGDLIGVGSIAVDVVNVNGISNSITVPITRPRVPLNIFSFHKDITREMQLLLLALFAGALGSYVHALKSLSDFIGNRTLTASWFWWYVTRPFLGMAMALMFYAVLRGGFLAGTPADARVVNPFGVIAIGALVGMFADQAALKLAEIFDTLFKAEDRRSGKLEAPVIDSLEPPVVSIGATKPVVVRIIGDRLGQVRHVRLNADERKPDSVSEKELTLTLKDEDLKGRAQIKVTAVNDEGTPSPARTLYVTDLAITTAALPDAPVNTPYPAALACTGGAPKYKWSLVEKPTWLSIDDTSGQLAGTPKTAGAVKVQVKVTDSEAAFVTKTFDLKVV